MINDSEIKQHYSRSISKMLRFGYSWQYEIETDQLIRNIFKHEYKMYQSIYIKEKYRNQGLFQKDVNRVPNTIVTLPECNLQQYLEKKNIPHILLEDGLETAYSEIEKYYGDKLAKRSGIPYINHIDEGLGILYLLGASRETKEIFTLHPIYQDGFKSTNVNNTLMYHFVYYSWLFSRKNYKLESQTYEYFEKELDANMDLRNIFIADKIQNYKDFMLNKKKYDDFKSIEQYFLWWFDTLEVSHRFLYKAIDYITI